MFNNSKLSMIEFIFNSIGNLIGDLAYELYNICYHNNWIIIILIVIHVLSMSVSPNGSQKDYYLHKITKVFRCIMSCIIILISLFKEFRHFINNGQFEDIDGILLIVILIVEILRMIYYLGIYNKKRLKYVSYLQLFNLLMLYILRGLENGIDQAF